MPGDGSSGAARAHRVLVVDGDSAMRRLLRRALDHFGCDGYEARNGPAMLGVLRRQAICAIVLDVPRPDATEPSMLDALDVPPPLWRATIAISSDPAALTHAARLGVPATLLKPFGLQELQDAIARAVAREGSRHAPMTPLRPAPAGLRSRRVPPGARRPFSEQRGRVATYG